MSITSYKKDQIDALLGAKAPTASPAFTGTPTIAGTAVARTTDISTAISNLVGSAPAALDTLQEIAAQIASDEGGAAALAAIVATKVTSYATVAAMKAVTPADNAYARTAGYYSLGDGGRGFYLYSAASTATDDGGSVIAPTSGTGRWLLAPEDAVSALQFGAKGDGTTDDLARLNALHTFCSTTGKVAVYPKKTYSVSGTVIATVAGGYCAVKGVPGAKIVSTSATATVFQVGNGASKPDLVNGYVEDMIFAGPTATPAQNGQAAFLLNAITQIRVTNVTVFNTDIGFDAINNSYGATFINCRAGFFNGCNVGMNIRSTPTAGSGNQWVSYGGWYEGKYAAVQMSPNTDGFIFHAGQMVQGRAASTSQDAYGAIVFGKDYIAGTTGSMGNVTIDSVDFEQCGGWILRGYQQASITILNCPMLSNGSTPTIGVMKLSDGGNGSYAFRNNRVRGPFSSAVAFSISEYGQSVLEESGWHNTGGATFNGVNANLVKSFFQQSGLTKGFSTWRDSAGFSQFSIDGMAIRRNGAALQVSSDNTNWLGLATTSVTAVDPGTVTGLVLDLDAARITGLADGAAVSTWSDVSGAGNDATQATGSLQPLYRTSWGTNLLPNTGRPVVVFDGTDDYLTSAASSSGAQTIFVVAAANAFAGTNYLLGSGGGAGGLALRLQGTGTQLFSEADAVATIAASQAITPGKSAHHVYALSYDGSSVWVLDYDGVETTGTSSNAVTASRTTKVGINNGNNVPWNGSIAKVLRYNSALTAANRQGVVAWLMKRYGIG